MFQPRNLFPVCRFCISNYGNEFFCMIRLLSKLRLSFKASDKQESFLRKHAKKSLFKVKVSNVTDDNFNETSYYFENGLRKVYPYYFTYNAFAKGRWVGRKLLDVFVSEFGVTAQLAEECERRILEGLLVVNNEKVTVDYIVKMGDRISSTIHRHETPVSSESITIVYQDKQTLVVNKPASIPVHPCGCYRHNSVIFILAKEHNLKNLRPVHRLDRLTSGLLIFGLCAEKANSLKEQFFNHKVQKEYVCQVEGEFPDGLVFCQEPISFLSEKIGIYKVSSHGKECATVFQKLSWNGKTSIVSCKPLTGRSHQIRVHLQYLGYPIVNDPIYNSRAFGPERGRGGRISNSEDQLIRELIDIHGETYFKVEIDSTDNITQCREGSQNVDKINLFEKSCGDETMFPKLRRNDNTQKKFLGCENMNMSDSPAKLSVDKHCYKCKFSYRDPRPSDLVMFLHAWKYCGNGWCYETELPQWASENWKD